MRGWRAAIVAWAARAVRGLWPDRNPLRRTIDRVEAGVAAGLAAAFLAGAPLAAVAAGHYAYSYASRTAASERGAWHEVPARLDTTVPASGYGDLATVRASWTSPDGGRRTGVVPAPTSAAPGGTVMVWVDEAGRLTGAPLQPRQVRGQAMLAAICAPMVVGLAVLCVALIAHGALEKRRLAAWDAQWRATGPQWTRHR
ncbi:MAG TPA: hypothetical protein VEH31_18595 [Streptosporangiaceae bacterium]|nr:hypothetical protein [Streptosporangiaceae bacterium]HYA50577.1 hypothetical protein [Streptosporangiaceae bacterium]